MAFYRDEIRIVSVRIALARVAPRMVPKITSVTLTCGSIACVVSLRRIARRGCIGTTTVWDCPTCHADANVIAFTPMGVGCRKCTPWRSRGYVAANRMAPHLGRVDASIASDP